MGRGEGPGDPVQPARGKPKKFFPFPPRWGKPGRYDKRNKVFHQATASSNKRQEVTTGRRPTQPQEPKSP